MRIGHKGLRALAEQDRTNQVPAELAARLRRILTALGEARRPGDLASRPGYRLHPLKGAMAGLCSIRVSGNWRVVFRFEDNLEPSARAATDPRTVQLALELLERTAGRRRRCRRCQDVIAENARKRGQAWSLCTPCAQAIEDEARQLEIEPALIPRCLVCRTDIAQLRAGARTCGDACRNVLSRLLRGRRGPVP